MLKLKAIDTSERSRPVDGFPVEEFRALAEKADEALHYNGTDHLATITGKELRRRLAAMPDGTEVAVMGGPNHAKRRYPVPTTVYWSHGRVVIQTHYLY